MKHPVEPLIATVTAMNAIHLQQLFAAHLKALHKERENMILSNPSLSSMQTLKTLFIVLSPACPSVLLGFYVSFILHILFQLSSYTFLYSLQILYFEVKVFKSLLLQF